MEVKQAEADARKAVAEAEGQAKAKVTRANADAANLLTVAEAQAKANRLLNESLTPTLVEWSRVQKWNGQLPTFTGGAMPMINLGAGKN